MKTERHEPIEGLELAQNIHINKAFEPLSKLKFDRVIEFGTQNGGFTIFISRLFNKIITFDNKSFRRTLDAFAKYPNILFIKWDIFENEKTIGELISQEGKTLLLCDNGNKIKEVATFSKYLKSGDYIMAHDYASSREHFRKEIQNKYWNCLEITDKDIDFEKHCLKKIDSITDKSAWLCAIKL